MRVCLDTNAYSRLMGGHPPLTQLLESADEVLLPATVLETGARLVTYDAHFKNIPGVIVLSP